jgi:hypothetical protein
MPVIKTREQASKPKPRQTAKASKPAPRKRGTAKPKAQAQTQERVNRSSKTDMPKRELNAILNPLTKAAEQREKHYEAWKSHVSAVNEMIVEALDAEVPVHMIVDAADVSRQHVYKIISDLKSGKRDNGGQATGKAGRPPAEKPKAKATAKKTGRRPASKSSGQTSGKARPRIRTRG